MNLKHYTLILLLLAFASCRYLDRGADKDDSPGLLIQELQRTDQAFSEYSKAHGMRKAFLEFIDDEGVIMRDNSLPLRGAPAIEYITAMDDSAVVLTWEPIGGDVAASGELGYTYGMYELRDSVNVQKGTYVTIWKKTAGKWKFVLDSGNQGVE